MAILMRKRIYGGEGRPYVQVCRSGDFLLDLDPKYTFQGSLNDQSTIMRLRVYILSEEIAN